MHKWQIIRNPHYTDRTQIKDPYIEKAIGPHYNEIMEETIEELIGGAIEEIMEMA